MSLVIRVISAGAKSLALAAAVALASAASLPGIPECPAIQWMAMGFESLEESIILRMVLANLG